MIRLEFLHPNLCKRAYNQIYAVSEYTDHNLYLLYGNPAGSAINLEKKLRDILSKIDEIETLKNGG